MANVEAAEVAPRSARVLVRAGWIVAGAAWLALALVGVALLATDDFVAFGVLVFMIFVGWLLVAGVVIAGLVISLGAVVAAHRERTEEPRLRQLAWALIASWGAWFACAWLLLRTSG